MVFWLIKYTKLQVTLCTEYFYLNKAVISLQRAKDVEVKINYYVLNVPKM